MTDFPPIVSLVCFDLAGIVIDDSVVERAFAETIATQGIVTGTRDYARSMVRFDRSRGRSPAAVLRELFDGDEPRAQVAAMAFDRSFRAAASRFGVDVPPQVADAIGKTAGAGAKVCLLTVLSRSSCDQLLGRFRLADAVLCADEVPRTFPWPDPVLCAMLRLGAADVREVAVVSATQDGVLSGYRAGAGMVIGLISTGAVGNGGAHRAAAAAQAAALREAGATHVIDNLAELSALLTTGSGEGRLHS
jgi:beta-phosphoglucomutase-like phosphatase (HAD superfamily)